MFELLPLLLEVGNVVVEFDPPARVLSRLDGFTSVFEPAFLVLVSRHHVAFEVFSICVVVVRRQNRLLKHLQIFDGPYAVLVDQFAFVAANDLLAIKPKVSFRRAVNPGDVKVLVEDEDADFDVPEDVVDKGLRSSRPVRSSFVSVCRRTPPYTGIRANLLRFDLVMFDKPLQSGVGAPSTEVKGLSHLRRRPWFLRLVEDCKGFSKTVG